VGTLLNVLVILLVVMVLGLPVLVISKIPSLRNRATELLRKRFGEGPTPAQRKASSTKVVTVAWDHNGASVGRSVISCPSDPGYGSTAKWIVEAALCLVEANKVEGGVSTPAACSAMGFKLVERVKHANLFID